MNQTLAGNWTSAATENQEVDKDLSALAGQWNPAILVTVSRPAILTAGPITEETDEWEPIEPTEHPSPTSARAMPF